MSRIPLIRASQAEPFLRAVRVAGRRATPLLEAVGLAPDVVHEDPDALVPEHAIWDFVGHCADATGAEHFGWNVGLDSPIGDLGAFGQRVGAAATLGVALETFLRAAAQHSSHARFSVVQSDGRVWFRRHGIDGIDVGAWQIELYVLGIMVHVVRLALGADWVPSHVRLKVLPPRGTRLPAALRGTHVHGGTGMTSIELPATALDAPLADADAQADPAVPIELALTESIRLVLRHALPTGHAGLPHAARLAGVTPRTLQRWLDREGSTFEALLDDLRREEALRRLAMPTATVAEIAGHLGYADPSNFTRAFRRWTRVAPRDYRASLAD